MMNTNFLKYYTQAVQQNQPNPQIVSAIAQEIQYHQNNIKGFVLSLVSGYTFVLGTVGYPAYMNHATKTITLNTMGIGMMLEPFYKMIQSMDYNKRHNFYYKFACGLALHECLHVKHTPPASRAEELAKELGIKSPMWWYLWVVNVVDDSFIQNKGRQDYPGAFINECLSYVESLVQGIHAVEEFSKKPEHDVKSMLFYLVLLSYNRMIEKPDAVKIPEELINEFLSIYYIDDDEERMRYTLQFADKLLDALFDETKQEMKKLKVTITNKPQPQSNQSGQEINPDDYDEIEVDFDIDPDLDDEDDKAGDQKGMPIPGQGASDSGDDGADAEDEDSDNKDDKASSLSKSDPTDDGKESEDADTNQKGTGIGNETGGGETPDDYTPEDVMDYLKDIVDALSQKDLTASEGEAEQSVFKDKNALDRAMVANGINRYSDRKCKYQLTDFATEVHGFFLQEFKRIQAFTFNKTVYYQPSGKFNNADAFRTNYSKNVFRQRFEPKRDMDLFCGIVLDASGSMGDYVTGNATMYDVMSDITIGLMDSLERVKAKTELLVFDDVALKVKDYNNSIDLEHMNAQIKQAYHSLGGGTDMFESVSYFYNAFKVKPHKDKCLLIFTDGATCNLQETSDLIMGMQRQGVLVIGIGLRLSDSTLSNFDRLFEHCEHKNYKTIQDIRLNIAKDLRELLSKTFMKNKI
ncbi:vWA domain-containing protein [Methanoculleus sp.]|uniref:vWA domain-containing protein n=1 Tax=Methanoculleus sp. TaxID=90427 RepID=UPI0025EB7CFF|nr:VWA domain-containing protein [Methanoculleus sp.]MCK9318951.1 VWA domain-containing protein [Methanoculleus sp.]